MTRRTKGAPGPWTMARAPFAWLPTGHTWTCGPRPGAPFVLPPRGYSWTMVAGPRPKARIPGAGFRLLPGSVAEVKRLIRGRPAGDEKALLGVVMLILGAAHAIDPGDEDRMTLGELAAGALDVLAVADPNDHGTRVVRGMLRALAIEWKRQFDASVRQMVAAVNDPDELGAWMVEQAAKDAAAPGAASVPNQIRGADAALRFLRAHGRQVRKKSLLEALRRSRVDRARTIAGKRGGLVWITDPAALLAWADGRASRRAMGTARNRVSLT